MTCSDATAPSRDCAAIVTRPERKARANRGAFSRIRERAVPALIRPRPLRPRGHQSSSRRIRGRTTSIGFASSPRANRTATIAKGRRCGPGEVPEVGAQGQQPQQRGQDRLALRDPGHGLHLHGVYGEECRDGGAAPERAAERAQQLKEQQRARGVQPEVHQVVGARSAAEETRVGHVREPGQGMPVGGVESGERPPAAAPAQPALHHAVPGDVIRVVEVDEIEAPDFAVHETIRREEQRDDQHGQDSPRIPLWFRQDQGALVLHPGYHRMEDPHHPHRPGGLSISRRRRAASPVFIPRSSSCSRRAPVTSPAAA